MALNPRVFEGKSVGGSSLKCKEKMCFFHIHFKYQYINIPYIRYRYLSVAVVFSSKIFTEDFFSPPKLGVQMDPKIFPLNHLAFGRCHLKTWEIYDMYWPDSVTQKKKKNLQSKNHMISGW